MGHAPYVALLLLMCAACSDGNTDARVPSDGSLSRRDIATIREAVNASLGRGLASGYSVAVWRDGRVIYAEGFGQIRESGAAVTTDTLFQIGSDTKKLTAIALLQQVDEGVVTLDDTLGELVPELSLLSAPDHLQTVRLADLLCHRSGLYDYTPWYDAPADDALAQTVLGTFAEHQFAMMPPGIAWNYSNANYALLGFVLEQLTGMSYARTVTSKVLAPLGLEHTYLRRDDMLQNESDIAHGHGRILSDPGDFFSPLEVPEIEIGWLTPAQQPDHAFTRPAGMVWSTASEQAELLGFFVEGDADILSDALRVGMLTKQTPLLHHIDSTSYGYAFIVEDGFLDRDGVYRPTRVLEHGGNTMTMTSSSMLLPRERVAVSVLANGDLEDLTQVARTALHVAAGARLPPGNSSPRFPPPARDFAGYAGEFEDTNLGSVTLSLRDGALQVAAPTLTALGASFAPTLEPIFLDLFTWQVEGTPLQLDFYDGARGEPHAFAVNRAFVLRRTEARTSRQDLTRTAQFVANLRADRAPLRLWSTSLLAGCAGRTGPREAFCPERVSIPHPPP